MPPVAALVAALREGGPRRLRSAIRGTPLDDLEGLGEELGRTADPAVREWALGVHTRHWRRAVVAARALGGFADEQATGVLLGWLSAEEEISEPALRSLEGFPDSLVVPAALEALGVELGAIEPIARLLKGRIQADDVARLQVQASNSWTSRPADAAAYVLRHLADEPTRRWALELARGSRMDPQRRAALVLGSYRDPDAVAAIDRLIALRPPPRMVAEAAVAAVKRQQIDIPGRLAPLVGHPQDEVREEVARAIGSTPGADGADDLFVLLSDPAQSVREVAREALDEVRGEAIAAGLPDSPEPSTDPARWAAAQVLSMSSTEEPTVRPWLHRWWDQKRDDQLAAAALSAIARCDPDGFAVLAPQAVLSRRALVRRAAANEMARAPKPAWLGPLTAAASRFDDEEDRWCFAHALVQLDDPLAVVPLTFVASRGAIVAVDVAEAALAGPDASPLARELHDRGLLFAEPGHDIGARLTLTRDASPELTDATIAFAREVIRRGSWRLRRSCATVLDELERPDAADLLCGLCRDPDEDVRADTLPAFARCADERVPAVVFAAMDDPDSHVREVAAELLDAPHAYAGLRRDGHDAEAFWSDRRAQLAGLRTWTRAEGWSFLGDPVELRYSARGAGRTAWSRPGRDAVWIEVNPAPLLAEPVVGEQVVRGVVVHEFGHHVYDFRRTGFKSGNGVAKSAGAGEVFDILLDERLERNLRSDRPEWGELIDRANAWLIQAPPAVVPIGEYAEALGIEAAELPNELAARSLPGELTDDGQGVRLGAWDILHIPGLLAPLHAFFLGLMAIRDSSAAADEPVRRALEMVPPDLKDLHHGELAQLAIRITETLGAQGGKEAWKQLQEQRRRFGSLLRSVSRLFDRLAVTGRRSATSLVRASSSVQRDGPQHDVDLDKWAERGSSADRRLIVVDQPPAPSRAPARGPAVRVVNLAQSLDFERLEHEEHLPDQPADRRRLISEVRPWVRPLRRHLERLTLRLQDEPGVRRGRRLDPASLRRAPVGRRTDILVGSREIRGADAYIGIVIDRSGSMEGEEIELARRFGVLLAEAARGVRGLDGHISAFDHRTFFRLGSFARHAISALEAGGGNNDAGGLLRAAELALGSRRRRRMLIMISDGLPTECSVEALRDLVRALQRQHGFVLAQVAVSPLEHQLFPAHLDVSGLPMDQATRQFGRLLTKLTARWR